MNTPWKAIVSLVVTCGVEKTINDILKAICPNTGGKFARILRFVGIGAITMMVADKTGNYIERKVDDVETAINKLKETLNDCTPARFDAAGVENSEDNNE